MRTEARLTEGIGLEISPRNPAHADPDWFQRDLDDQIEDPDVEPFDPLPTPRHRQVPEGLS